MANILYASGGTFYNKPYEEFLQGRGHRVRHVGSFPEALESVQGGKFDIVVTEILLNESPPDSVRLGRHYCSGFSLIDAMRQDGPNKDTPVVVYSVLGRQMLDEELERRGLKIHLQAPVELETLEQAVNSGLTQK